MLRQARSSNNENPGTVHSSQDQTLESDQQGLCPDDFGQIVLSDLRPAFLICKMALEAVLPSEGSCEEWISHGKCLVPDLASRKYPEPGHGV